MTSPNQPFDDVPGYISMGPEKPGSRTWLLAVMSPAGGWAERGSRSALLKKAMKLHADKQFTLHLSALPLDFVINAIAMGEGMKS